MIQGTVVKVSEVAYGPLVTFLTSPKPLGQFYQTLLKILLNYWIQGFFLNEGQHPILKEMKKNLYIHLKKNWPTLKPHPNPGIMIWTLLHLRYLRMLQHKLPLFWLIGPTIPQGIWFEQLKSKLPDDPHVTAFLAEWFLRRFLEKKPTNFQKNVYPHYTLRINIW